MLATKLGLLNTFILIKLQINGNKLLIQSTSQYFHSWFSKRSGPVSICSLNIERNYPQLLLTLNLHS